VGSELGFATRFARKRGGKGYRDARLFLKKKLKISSLKTNATNSFSDDF
jgi:DNA-binding MurR/RpiR family transcriptional regulator